jgi:tetratricopeptide (TPR) repeat protein
MPKVKDNNNQIIKLNGKLIICLILVILVLALFWPLSHYQFINYDDNIYVTENRQVTSGLTLRGVIWALSINDLCNWHPLTWLSHMADVELYGLNAGGHHLTNVLFHIANTLLLFILLTRFTAARWPSVFVAALFALHPLHVESVAWVSERKDVLSTFWGILTLIGYAQYTQQRRRSWYGLSLLFFALGLMAKAMLVTLPFLFLLLDYWPLGRFNFSKGFRPQPAGGVSSVYFLLMEKLPFIIITAVSCIVAYYAQQSSGAMMPFEMHPFSLRISNAIVSYVGYIGKMLWPARLAIFYPLPDSFELWQVTAAAIVLLGLSLAVLVQVRKRPYLAVGWFWYLGTLVPVIGLVQIGGQSMADRYTYVPLIGLFVMVAWGGAELIGANRQRRILGAIAAAGILAALMGVSRMQVGYWANSITIFEQTIKATGGSWVAHNNLALALSARGRINAAIHHYRLALEKDPPEPEGIYYNLAIALSAQDRNSQAIEHYSKALKINPEYAAAHINMGTVLARQGKTADAIRHYTEAIRIEPNSEKAHFNLGNILLAQDKIDEAISHYSKAAHIDPFFAEAYNGLGLALMQKGKLEEAILQFRKAANIKPAYRDAQKNQKLAESIYGNIRKAVAAMQDSMNFYPQDPEIDLKMFELLEKKKKLDQALSQFNKALSLQPGFTSLDRNRISIVLEIKKKYEAKLAQFHEIIERRPDNAAAGYHIACIYSRRGQIDDAIKWLNQAIQKGFNRWDLIKTDSDLNGVRSSKQYQVLIKG